MTLREFCNNNSVNISGGYFDHKVNDKTYRIFPANTADGSKILFIPSIGAMSDHDNGVRKLADTEVINDGITATDGTPILFLHRPASFSGTIDLGF